MDPRSILGEEAALGRGGSDVVQQGRQKMVVEGDLKERLMQQLDCTVLFICSQLQLHFESHAHTNTHTKQTHTHTHTHTYNIHDDGVQKVRTLLPIHGVGEQVDEGGVITHS